MTSPRFRNDYVADWRELSRETKARVGNRCVRCFHPFGDDGRPLYCDHRCDASRGMHSTPENRAVGLNFGIHHLDGDKANNAWWNLLPLCNSCHLTIQARVIPERPWLLAHSDWFRPYVAGFYAHYYGRLEISRTEAEADTARFLAMGQPWLYPEISA